MRVSFGKFGKKQSLSGFVYRVLFVLVFVCALTCAEAKKQNEDSFAVRFYRERLDPLGSSVCSLAARATNYVGESKDRLVHHASEFYVGHAKPVVSSAKARVRDFHETRTLPLWHKCKESAVRNYKVYFSEEKRFQKSVVHMYNTVCQFCQNYLFPQLLKATHAVESVTLRILDVLAEVWRVYILPKYLAIMPAVSSAVQKITHCVSHYVKEHGVKLFANPSRIFRKVFSFRLVPHIQNCWSTYVSPQLERIYFSIVSRQGPVSLSMTGTTTAFATALSSSVAASGTALAGGSGKENPLLSSPVPLSVKSINSMSYSETVSTVIYSTTTSSPAASRVNELIGDLTVNFVSLETDLQQTLSVLLTGIQTKFENLHKHYFSAFDRSKEAANKLIQHCHTLESGDDNEIDVEVVLESLNALVNNQIMEIHNQSASFRKDLTRCFAELEGTIDALVNKTSIKVEQMWKDSFVNAVFDSETQQHTVRALLNHTLERLSSIKTTLLNDQVAKLKKEQRNYDSRFTVVVADTIRELFKERTNTRSSILAKHKPKHTHDVEVLSAPEEISDESLKKDNSVQPDVQPELMNVNNEDEKVTSEDAELDDTYHLYQRNTQTASEESDVVNTSSSHTPSTTTLSTMKHNGL
ncbi:hypothetical protein SJAG_00481 [Schizosaccharomyces japonicus yFS275]|uniref:Uncharacterized protein n=1 Tax=Schizosaccharomyces japonicus (strain yFS275 / FY16936) TaxID=402676 RepID=B6JVR5_SCHJY|nr:hypothetical protein SJAG_00481 [Schizosaccharomyces japonicus yFS275]EEB05466.1 hypothetical protein SJAG_00481 [Schizosaccharomyces japonicus yFS275]